MQRVLITGASGGLGAGLARAYAAQGALIGLVARRAHALEEVARQVHAAGGRAIVLPGDVRDSAAMARILRDFVEAARGIDVCIANAGVAQSRTDDRWDVAG